MLDNLSLLNIVDILFATGTCIFLISLFPLVRKLRKVKCSDAHSLLHNELDAIAMATMLIGYFIMAAPLSIVVTIVELLIRFYLIVLIRKKRSYELKYPADIIYYTVKGGRALYAKLLSGTSSK
jgi:hypothetical protein